MIYRSPKNPFSHLTTKDRRWPSYPTKQLFSRSLIKGRVLDFGCGLGVDVEFLRTNKIDVTGYDPYYQPEYPEAKFDTILCNYVLNVLLPEEQAHVLMAVSELLNPSGKAYYAVRRDIKRSGFRYNPKHKCKTYQCNIVLPFKSLILTEHCEIFEYRHINQLKTLGQNKTCALCHPGPDEKLLTESAMAYALFYDNSSSKGRALIIPKRHSCGYFDLSFREQCACWLIVNRVKNLLLNQLEPVGFKIELASNNSDLTKSKHPHIDLIPRF